MLPGEGWPMNISKRSIFIVIAIAILTSACGDSDDVPQTSNPAAVLDDRVVESSASYVFTNGKVYTVNEKQPWAEAVAVDGNKIVFVGSNTEARKYIGKKSKVINLKGKMMLPGFVEGHIHVVAGGVMANGLDLQTDDKEEIFARIREYVVANDDEVILGYGVRFNPWDGDLPTAAMLDEIESKRPMFFWAIDGHAAWVNSKALELAGVDKNTPDPVPGFSHYARDADGNPTGWLVELPTQMQVLSKLVNIDREYTEQGVRNWMPRLSAAGITSAHDLGVQGMEQTEGYQIVADMAEKGKLPMRIQGVYYWNDPKVDPIPGLIKMRDKFSSDVVSVSHLKINLDGGDEGWNGLYTFPYADKPEIVPDPIIPYDVLNNVVRRADAAGIDVICHCFGDLAVRKLLDAIEAAIKVNPRRQRHHAISHATIVHPDDRQRFAELGVTYDTSGSWIALDPVQLKISAVRLGLDRVNQGYPIRQIADLGGNISLGSDWPASGYISEYRPLIAIQTAVTRQPIGAAPDSQIMGGKEWRLTVEQAVRANTLGAATGMGRNEQIGSLEVGKFADMIVLDQNLFEIDSYAISNVKVLKTIMNGKLVHESS